MDDTEGPISGKQVNQRNRERERVGIGKAFRQALTAP